VKILKDSLDQMLKTVFGTVVIVAIVIIIINDALFFGNTEV
jgi:hypothetical protein